MPPAISIIRSEGVYQAALAEYESYFDNEPAVGTSEADRFELLGVVLAKYEEDLSHLPALSPASVIRYVMESNGRRQSDLAALFGSKSRASELLNGRRDLSLSQIRVLRREWHIPADALLGEIAGA
jgi:HTH-type transcriptional regulator/antitoxin HigA